MDSCAYKYTATVTTYKKMCKHKTEKNPKTKEGRWEWNPTPPPTEDLLAFNDFWERKNTFSFNDVTVAKVYQIPYVKANSKD